MIQSNTISNNSNIRYFDFVDSSSLIASQSSIRVAIQEFTEEQSIPISLTDSNNNNFCHFVWPSSVCLANYVFQHFDEIINNKEYIHILELSGGCCLPSILATLLMIKRKQTQDTSFRFRVTFSDYCIVSLDRIRQSLKLNHLNENDNKEIYLLPIEWGRFSPLLLSLNPMPDLILASDVFYNVSDFDAIFATIRYLLEMHISPQQARFITSIHIRSADHSFIPWLLHWGLKMNVISQTDDDDETNNNNNIIIVEIILC